MGQPPQRVAAGAHPLLVTGPGIRPAAGDADVLPRRPVLRVRPDLQLGARLEGPPEDDRRLLDARHRPELGGRVQLRHLPAGAGRDAARGGALIYSITPSQTVGPYFAIGLPWDAGPF